MPTEISVKICGLTAPEHVRDAADAGARYLGFNFFARSPRYVSPEQAATLVQSVPIGVAKVALVVNAPDEFLDKITASAPFDMLQLHGGESAERVSEIKARYGLPVMKVIGVADAEDLAAIDLYNDVADQILIDAKPPKNAVLPGGNGLAFDWRLLAGRKYWRKPWMLAGGLKPENVAEAIRTTGARQVDVASGVESEPGVKDSALIRAFIDATR
ncbi:phosphoribosylanthranilate isomerase [Ruegeria halocynthiae]|uniref:N-(5'-phosphoribosyl)anthranilate isomerase n=1 Tax=Ruegeria halocynthiae TaxID=985054 RepID=A0A1H2W085_9RHOB|nr:phosphoribosylanthranilate isomerase [Ruegeria halocynthiae]SDW74062.1 phosphoribosylanthranilate isomerase [Ruegeria halocynthiae]